MTLRTVAIPDPALGDDWITTVPGKYLYDVTGITATLTNGGNSPVVADASGNGYDGTYVSGGTPPSPRQVAGLVTGDLALQAKTSAFSGWWRGDIASPIIDWSQDWTIAWWQKASYSALGMRSALVASFPGPVAIQAGAYSPGTESRFRIGDAGVTCDFFTATGVAPPDGDPHWFVVTYNAGTGTPTLYVDGAPVAWAGAFGAFPADVCDTVTIGGLVAPNVIDEVVTVDGQWSAFDVSSFYTAGLTDFATWNAAILLNIPVSFYHLDDAVAGSGRQVALGVATSTGDVMQIGTGFPAVATSGPYDYSWQPNISTSQQLPSGTLTTVAIPRLILPAGYTVGTRTLDLDPTCQWSDITLWWDDRVMVATGALDPYVFPPSVQLVNQQIGLGT